jgi:hypothetical protein
MATRATGAVSASISTTAAAVVTAGANEAVLITTIIAYNADTQARLLTLYQVPSAGSAGASTLFLKQTVYAGQSATIPVGALIVSNGASLQAQCDANSVLNLSVNFYRTDQQA